MNKLKKILGEDDIPHAEIYDDGSGSIQLERHHIDIDDIVRFKDIAQKIGCTYWFIAKPILNSEGKAGIEVTHYFEIVDNIKSEAKP